MAADLLRALIGLNLAAGGAILVLLGAGGVLRRLFGARLAYAAWLIVPVAALASVLPPRAAGLLPVDAAPVRALAGAAVEAVASDLNVLILIAWGAVALALLAALVLTHCRAVRRLGPLSPEGPDLVRASRAGAGPAAFGVLRPRILLPADFEQRFAPGEQALILAHERAHLAAGDPRINALVAALRCLLWANPLVHLAARRVRRDQELACDAAVLARFPGQRRTYAETLLKSQTALAALPLACAWPSGKAGGLKARIRMLDHAPGRRRRTIGAAVVTAVGLATGVAAWSVRPDATPLILTVEAAPLTVAPTAHAPVWRLRRSPEGSPGASQPRRFQIVVEDAGGGVAKPLALRTAPGGKGAARLVCAAPNDQGLVRCAMADGA